jgi:acetyltransferase-like isoleucine patch superfamily enzyme
MDKLPLNSIIKYRAPVILGEIELKSNIEIGAYTYFDKGRIGSLRRIGNYCSIAPGCVIGNGNHPTDFLSTHPIAFNGAGAFNFDSSVRNYQGGIDRPAEVIKDAPTIGSDVWVGGNVTILRGVTIGNGVIIGSNSLVNRDIPDFAIVAGIPAKIIKMRFLPAIVQKIQASNWWDYDMVSLTKIPWDKPEEAVEIICMAIEEKKIPTLNESRPFKTYKHK